MHLRQWLLEEYNKRREKNASFSMRAFARVAGVSSGQLSEFLSGKRELSESTLKRIIEKLKPETSVEQWLKSLVLTEKRRQPNDKVKKHKATPFTELDEAHTIDVIRDWHYFAIMCLLDTEDGEALTSDSMAARLSLSHVTVKESLEKLVCLRLIQTDGLHFKTTGARLTTTIDVPSEAIRFNHLQKMDLAKKSLVDDPVGVRDFSSSILALDPADLELAKALITKFRRNFCSQLESGSRKEVYLLNVQLLPLTKSK